MATEEPRPTALEPESPPPGGGPPPATRPGLAPTAAVVAACLALAGLAWALLLPPATLDERRFQGLAEARRFGEAESLLKGHLGGSPGDARAHFLMAQLLVERPDLEGEPLRDAAERALAHLRKAEGGAGVAPELVELYRGRALYLLDRWDQAEAAWDEALRIEPTVPEAGFQLLGLYYRELRRRETRELALKLFAVEPNLGDRARLLLEPMHADAVRPDPISLVPLFAKAVEADPKGLRSRVALGLCLVLSSEIDRGLDALREAVDEYPESEAAWDGYLDGIVRAGKAAELGGALAKLPERFAGSPRFARHLGLAAEERKDWPAAVAAYRRALEFDEADFETGARLERVLRLDGRAEEADRWRARVAEYRRAQAELLPLFEEAEQAAAGGRLGVVPMPDLVERITRSREQMWCPDEAEAWRALERLVREAPAEPEESGRRGPAAP
jgi:tetratricopeptide (TPR) repeat protein